MALPGINFGGGGKGGFDFGDFRGGSISSGPLNIDARTTTGGGDPELLGQVSPLLVIAGIALVAVFAMRAFKR